MQFHLQMASFGGGHTAAPHAGGFHHHQGPVELGPNENAVLTTTAGRARTWGILALVSGVFSLLLVVVFAVVGALLAHAFGLYEAVVSSLVVVSLVPAAVVYLASGALYVRAGGALRAVVDTSGDDLGHLMKALGRLRLAFQIEVGVTVLAILFGLVSSFVPAVASLVAR